MTYSTTNHWKTRTRYKKSKSEQNHHTKKKTHTKNKDTHKNNRNKKNNIKKSEKSDSKKRKRQQKATHCTVYLIPFYLLIFGTHLGHALVAVLHHNVLQQELFLGHLENPLLHRRARHEPVNHYLVLTVDWSKRPAAPRPPKKTEQNKTKHTHWLVKTPATHPPEKYTHRHTHTHTRRAFITPTLVVDSAPARDGRVWRARKIE